MTIPMTPVPPNHPLMKYWKAYIATPEFENTSYWAQFHDHINGALWAAFCAGFEARSATVKDEIQVALAEYRGDLRC